MRSAGFAASFSEFIVNQVKLSDCFAVERLTVGEDPVPATCPHRVGMTVN
jgi:hypothetical protein